ncbi:MAG TPA: ParB/RepB/Spo0J family partition protein [Thermohalobaculum sp.]|nr:ParB/RepB/Spo0J family partition protein [Thermohalobaculum sp.]
MSRKPERTGLGRGLSALLGDLDPEPVTARSAAPGSGAPGTAESALPAPGRGPASVPIESLRPNPEQPRRDFPERELAELAESIRQRGIIQPVIVRRDPSGSGNYQIVAGERRWRAAQRARLHDIPVVIRDLDDRAVLELAIIENVQRSDLNPIEEAAGYAQLIERFGHTQDEMAGIVGKSRPHVANTLRLLNLPQQIQEMLRAGKLSAGHGRALLGAADPVALAEQAVLRGLTVRQVEDLARRAPPVRRKARGHGGPRQKDADTRVLEGDLSAAIGMAVSIEHGTAGSGEMRIRYRDLDELDRLCQRLAR